jgi:quinol monooxygenase YgiN
MTTHMVICEALTDELASEVVGKMQEHVRGVPGLTAHSILVEEGGRMVILITDWPNRHDCLAHHTGRAYRQFVAATQHMLVGSYVVKVFANKACLH